jgi:hypothetical protein
MSKSRQGIPFNTTSIPSLAPIVDTAIEEAGIQIVPGRVTDQDGQIFANFTIASSDMAKMTADEMHLLYLKPATEEIAKRIVAYADGCNLCTAAPKLPPKGSPMIGFRCMGGKIPVNVYIGRRPAPDRHQIIIETRVTKVQNAEEE